MGKLFTGITLRNADAPFDGYEEIKQTLFTFPVIRQDNHRCTKDNYNWIQSENSS